MTHDGETAIAALERKYDECDGRIRALKPAPPTLVDVAAWPEWQAFAARLGIPSDLRTTGIVIDLQIKQPTKITLAFHGGDKD
jgi:hypothetical protein